MKFDERILNKLDKIQDDITEIKITNASQCVCIEQNTKDLTEHIQGVKQNRSRIEMLEKQDARITMLWKVILGIGTLTSIGYTIYKFFI